MFFLARAFSDRGHCKLNRRTYSATLLISTASTNEHPSTSTRPHPIRSEGHKQKRERYNGQCNQRLVMYEKVSSAHNVIKICQRWKCYNCISKMYTWNNLHRLSKVICQKIPLDVEPWTISHSVLGFFSLAKQKIKSVQDNFSTNNPLEQINSYAQYFSVDPNETTSKSVEGYSRSYTDAFHKERKKKADQIGIETTRLLLRLERLTSTDENVPRNRNTKERRSEDFTTYLINHLHRSVTVL